jgi:hypothetical protein
VGDRPEADRGFVNSRRRRRHYSAAPRQGKADEAKRQHGPRGKLWNRGRGRASGDHDFRVGVGEVRVDGEESARAQENAAFTKGWVETIIRELAGCVHKQEIGMSKEYGIEIPGMALEQSSWKVSAIEKSWRDIGEISLATGKRVCDRRRRRGSKQNACTKGHETEAQVRQHRLSLKHAARGERHEVKDGPQLAIVRPDPPL